jgi:hypothetical protein
MKLDYIFKFCRKNKYISLKQYGDMKYLSDGEVTVLVQGISPQWEIDDYFTAMGIDEASREKYQAYDCTNEQDPEIEVKELDKLSALPFTIGSGSEIYKLFTRTDGRIMILNTKYITAFRDEFAIEYYSRGDGYLIFVVSRGICVGIITATSMNMQQLTEFARIIRDGFKRNYETNFMDNGGQIEITD